MTRPLISCVMATRNRPGFLPQALRCFLYQTYSNRELIVVDDSDRPARALCEGLPRVRYLRLPRFTPLGAKLNLAIEAARGDIIQKLDDDDFYGPGFLETSAAHMPKRGLSSTVVARCCFLILMRDGVLRHSGHGWTVGGTLCFHRALWKARPFRKVRSGEDSWFLRDHQPRIVRVCDVEQYVVLRHGGNTWNEMAGGETADEYLGRRRTYEKALGELVAPWAARFYRSIFRQCPVPRNS